MKSLRGIFSQGLAPVVQDRPECPVITISSSIVISRRKRGEADDGDQHTDFGQRPGCLELENGRNSTSTSSTQKQDQVGRCEEPTGAPQTPRNSASRNFTREGPVNMRDHMHEDDGIKFFDDITGVQLNKEKAKKARQNELDEL